MMIENNNNYKYCLLVDSNFEDQEIFETAIDLIGLNIECSTVIDGAQCLELLNNKNFVPDFIFIDINFKAMDGVECLKAIKKIAHLQNTPLIIYSDPTFLNYMNKIKSLKIHAFLTKPIEVTFLCKKLAKIFKEKT
ncbi:MAG: response regulator [Bacteroidetes bacterium]|nr:response regulator [Bacteroidota bacterium]